MSRPEGSRGAIRPSSTAALALAAGLAASACQTPPVVTVGNPGNVEDATGFGGVDYAYQIGQLEVTNAEYVRFLNAVAKDDPHGLYNAAMGSDPVRGGITRIGAAGSYAYAAKPSFANKPVNYVSWLDAVRYVNWLTNGSAITEDGAYDLSLSPAAVVRKPGARWVLPTEDEWYKAAYHDPTAPGGYWLYPTRSASSPLPAACGGGGEVLNPGANVANHLGGCAWNGSGADGNVSAAGGTTSPSYYRTLDQGGNLFEWTEGRWDASSWRVIRGGAFGFDVFFASTGGRLPLLPTQETAFLGFRVARPCPGVDGDADCVLDVADNCSLVANPTQRDADRDGYGNACDCDFDQNGIGGFPDFNVLLACFGKTPGPGACPASEPACVHDPTCAESDMNADGLVDEADHDPLFLACFGGPPGPGPAPDDDRDGVPQSADNCTLVANFSQRDADADGYGNACDCDFDQNGSGGFADTNVLLACLGMTPGPGTGPADDPTCEESDMNADGIVDDADFALFEACFGGPPGPAA